MRFIHAGGAFTQSDVMQELSDTVHKILNDNNIDEKKHINGITEHQNGIMLCILSLLQSSRLKLHDGTVAESTLSIRNINEVAESDATPDTVTYNGDFPVPWSKNRISVSVILTNVQVTEHFGNTVLDLAKRPSFSPFEVVRNADNKLIVNAISQQ